MTPPDFNLQPSDIPQPKLLDEEISTTNWPMPPAKAWEPKPKPKPTVWQRIKEGFR